MSEFSSSVRAALLATFAAPASDHIELYRKLSVDEWHTLGKTAEYTRTAPLLSHALGGCATEAPAEITDRLGKLARQYALFSLQQGKVLSRVLRSLRELGMAPIALKGAALAFRDYPQPQLRPLRDIDLLLPVEEAVAARELLLAEHGFEPHPAAGIYGPEHTHQLPEIRHRESGLVVEFHHRINASGWEGEARLLELIRADCDEIDLLGEPMRVPSAKANLLHLVEHAGRHHLFANGPLILSDLHYLSASHELDWKDIKATAEEIGLGRSIALIAEIARAHGARWVPDTFRSPDASLVDAAEYAIVADDETSRRHAQMSRHERRSNETGSWFSAVSRAFQPDRDELARIAGHPPQSAKRWLGYPAWLREKGGRFLAGQSDEQFRARQSGYIRLGDWLKAKG